jgi:serine protease Do
MSSNVLCTGLIVAALAVPVVEAQTHRTPQPKQESGRIQFPQARSVSTIGVQLADVTAENMKTLKLARAEGAVVESVNPNSPAAAATVHEKDVIVLFDGERVRSASHLTRLVHETPAGREIVMTVMRDGRRTELHITPIAAEAGWFDPRFSDLVNSDEFRQKMEEARRELGRRLPEAMEHMREGMLAPGRGRLGVSVQPLGGDLPEYFGVKSGVLVSSVVPDSSAAKAGLRAGDVITAVNGQAIASPRELIDALPGGEGPHDVTLTIVRDRQEMTVKATVGATSQTGVRI